MSFQDDITKGCMEDSRMQLSPLSPQHFFKIDDNPKNSLPNFQKIRNDSGYMDYHQDILASATLRSKAFTIIVLFLLAILFLQILGTFRKESSIMQKFKNSLSILEASESQRIMKLNQKQIMAKTFTAKLQQFPKSQPLRKTQILADPVIKRENNDKQLNLKLEHLQAQGNSIIPELPMNIANNKHIFLPNLSVPHVNGQSSSNNGYNPADVPRYFSPSVAVQSNRRSYHPIAMSNNIPQQIMAMNSGDRISFNHRQNALKWRQLVNQDLNVVSQVAEQQRKYYQQKYKISQYQQLPFCIVVPTFNNVQQNRWLNNIRSIVMQDYRNYHIVVIDDGSTDKTGLLISAYLQNNQTKLENDKYTIIVNVQQKHAMANLRKAAMELCQPMEIFLIVDGDDQLLGRQVLKFFNSQYQSKNAWFVYSNFLGSNGDWGYSRPFPRRVVEQNSYRNYPFVTSHLRTFYTQLFRNIKEEDLKDENGQYFSAANDVAICIPILQQAHRRVYYVPQITYYYNSNTGNNNHQIRLDVQKANDRKVRNKKKYNQQTELIS